MTSKATRIKNISLSQPEGRTRQAIPIHRASEISQRLAIWLILIALCTPTIPLFFAGVKLTPLRIAIICLLFPALSVLAQADRRIIVSDLFAVATAAWMIGATFVADGFQTSAFIEALEFVGAYFIGRAYVFGRPALQTFVGALEILIIVMVALALLDNASGRNIVYETISTVLPTTGAPNELRMGMVRATATFDGSHWLGTFCACAAAIFFYSERSPIRRAMYVGLSVLGCILAFSSSPLMAAVIVASAYFYDRALAQVAWRWKLFISLLAAFYLALSMISNDPVASIVGHLTFDPSNGWFRLNTWAHAWVNIGMSPWFGYGFKIYGDPDDFWDQASVDCVYLVFALRFGIPAVALLVMTNIASFSQLGSSFKSRTTDRYMDHLGTGSTLMLVVFLFVGVTIHFWNAPWSMWAFFIGIRASLKEYYLKSRGTGPGHGTELAPSGRAWVSRTGLRVSPRGDSASPSVRLIP